MVGKLEPFPSNTLRIFYDITHRFSEILKYREFPLFQIGRANLRKIIKEAPMEILEHLFRHSNLNEKICVKDYLVNVIARCGTIECMELAIKYGARLDVTDDRGKGPLHWACIMGSWEMVKFLLDLGLDPSIPDHSGFTPRIYASKSRSVKIPSKLQVMLTQMN